MDRRHVVRAAVVAVTAASALVGPAVAYASEPATSATLTMTSDAGDYLGQGLTYSYSTPTASFTTQGDAVYYDGNMAQISLSSGSDWWYLAFQAPTGQKLTPGVTYDNAIRGIQSAPPPGASPRMEIFGNGRGCNTLTGTFTVLGITYGPYGYLQSFHATFEDHCEGADPALRGEIDVTAPPAPSAQALQLTIAGDGTAVKPGGAAVVHGTITCTTPGTYYIDVAATQQTKKGPLSGTAYSVPADCTGSTPARWKATITSGTGALFTAGDLNVNATSGVFDSYYTSYLGQNPIYAYESQTATVHLQFGH